MQFFQQHTRCYSAENRRYMLLFIFLYEMLIFRKKKSAKFVIFRYQEPTFSINCVKFLKNYHRQYEISADAIKNCSTLQPPDSHNFIDLKNILKGIFVERSRIPRKWWKLWCLFIEFCEESIFLIKNFLKCPFFWYWILWRVRFSNIEFCEMSENGLNFPPRQTPVIALVYICISWKS